MEDSSIPYTYNPDHPDTITFTCTHKIMKRWNLGDTNNEYTPKKLQVFYMVKGNPPIAGSNFTHYSQSRLYYTDI